MLIGLRFECEVTGIIDPNPSDLYTVALVGPSENWFTIEGNSIKLAPKQNHEAGFYTLELLVSDNNSSKDLAGVLSIPFSIEVELLGWNTRPTMEGTASDLILKVGET